MIELKIVKIEDGHWQVTLQRDGKRLSELDEIPPGGDWGSAQSKIGALELGLKMLGDEDLLDEQVLVIWG